MNIIFRKIGFIEILIIIYYRVVLFNRDIKYFYLEKSILKNIKKLDWDHKDMNNKDNLSLQIYIRDKLLDQTIDELIENSKLNSLVNENKNYILLYIKKLLSIYTIPGSKTKLSKFLYIVLCLQKIFNSKDIIFYSDINFELNKIKKISLKYGINYKREFKNYFLSIFITYYLILFKNYIKFIFQYFKRFSDNTLHINNKNNIIVELPTIKFLNPYIFENLIDSKNMIFVNKEHIVSKEDYILLKKFKINFIGYSKKIVNNLNLKFFLTNVGLNFIENKKKFKNRICFEYNNLLYNYYLTKFNKDYSEWSYFFKLLKAKVYFTNYVYSPHSIAASLAIRDLNGYSCSFKASFSERDNYTSSTISDVFLHSYNNFSEDQFENKSINQYHKNIGYFNDYKFKYFISDAKKQRNILHKKGIKFIISFFDQGTTGDKRYGFSHDRSAKNYQFLFEKLILNKNMALIIKPKKPKQLTEKLKKINDIFEKAKKTNRLILVETYDNVSDKNSKYPPSYYAMISDLAIHDTLVSGSAGIDAYCSRVNTVFLDFYNFKESIFRSNKNIKIVYENLNELWNDIESKFIFENKHNIGNWNGIMNKIDPINDWKANHRIANILLYLQKSYFNENSINKNLEDFQTEFN